MGAPFKSTVKNALTVDVEEWFQVSVFNKRISSRDWPQLESTVEANVFKILEIFHQVGVQATFFILGWVAERYPELVLEIRKQGHEIGSHGYGHEIIYEQSEKAFHKDVHRASEILSEITGEPVMHYRAPSYSITMRNLWAWQVLLQHGFKYDSSIFPILHDVYGIPGAPRFPFRISIGGRELIEFPLSTIKVFRHNVPIAGGAYLRLYPLWFIRKAIRRLNRYGKPFILYFHPWELDQKQPTQSVPLPTYLRHYGNIDTMEDKLRALLQQFEFVPMTEVLRNLATIPFWPH